MLVWSFVTELIKRRMDKRIESILQKGVESLQAYTRPGSVGNRGMLPDVRRS
jgi:hypothetical protein